MPLTGPVNIVMSGERLFAIAAAVPSLMTISSAPHANATKDFIRLLVS